MSDLSELKVSLWRKTLLFSACGGSALFAIVIAIASIVSQRDLIACEMGAGFLLILMLAGTEIIRQCSLTLNEDCITQVAFFSAGKVIAIQRLQWSNITRVSFKNGTFVLYGSDVCIKIKVFILGDPRDVILFISKRLPKGLANYPVGV